MNDVLSTYMPKLTLSVDEEVVRRAKRCAAARGTSVSRLVERYLDLLSKSPKADDQTPVLRVHPFALAATFERADSGTDCWKDSRIIPAGHSRRARHRGAASSPLDAKRSPKAWRLPIRIRLPYQSPSFVVDRTLGDRSNCFSRNRSACVHRRTTIRWTGTRQHGLSAVRDPRLSGAEETRLNRFPDRRPISPTICKTSKVFVGS